MENFKMIVLHDVGIEADDEGLGLILPHMRWLYLLLVLPLAWIPLTVLISECLAGNAQGAALAIAGLICGVTFFIIGAGCTWCTIEVTASEFKFSSWAGSAVWKRTDIDTVEIAHIISDAGRSNTAGIEVALTIFILGAVAFLLMRDSYFWVALAGTLFLAGGIPRIHRLHRADLIVYVSRKQAALLEPRRISVKCKRAQAQSLVAALRSDNVTSSDPSWVKRLTNPGD
jgi:hypothetical protein